MHCLVDQQPAAFGCPFAAPVTALIIGSIALPSDKCGQAKQLPEGSFLYFLQHSLYRRIVSVLQDNADSGILVMI